MRKGSTDIKSLYIGTQKVCKVYYGIQLVHNFCNVGTVCDVKDITTPVPREVSTTGSWVKKDSASTMGIGGGINGVGGLYLTGGPGTILNQSMTKDFPTVKGRTYNVSAYAMKTKGTGQTLFINNEEFNGITSSWVKYTATEFTATANVNFEVEAIARNFNSGSTDDDILVDNIEIVESPYELYPTGNAASTGTDLANVGPWVKASSTEANTILQATAPGNGSNFAIRILLTTVETFPVVASAVFSIDVKDGRPLDVKFDAKASYGSTGDAKLYMRQSGIEQASVGIDDSGIWKEYTVTVTPTEWGLLSFEFEVTRADEDFIEFDNFSVVQQPCT